MSTKKQFGNSTLEFLQVAINDKKNYSDKWDDQYKTWFKRKS